MSQILVGSPALLWANLPCSQWRAQNSLSLFSGALFSAFLSDLLTGQFGPLRGNRMWDVGRLVAQSQLLGGLGRFPNPSHYT
jgi:hypothetical protein